jgi:hypothetical protein
VVAWYANTVDGEQSITSFINITDYVLPLELSWKDVGLTGGSYSVRDLWQRKNLGSMDRVKITLAPHASVLYKVSKR